MAVGRAVGETAAGRDVEFTHSHIQLTEMTEEVLGSFPGFNNPGTRQDDQEFQ